ncbi:MAG: hypothetical protein ACI4UV_15830 [Victivallales bacterium]
MRTFKDNEGREWTVSMNVGSVKRIRDMAKVDIFGSGLQSFVETVTENPVMLVDVLYAAIQPQAEKREISGEAFAEAIAGDVIETASSVLLAEIVDFFPKAKRNILKRILETSQEVEAKMNSRLAELVESPEYRKKLEENADSALSSVTGLPE